MRKDHLRPGFLGIAILFIWLLPSTPDVNGPRALRGILTVLGQGAGSPDDLAIGADDTIYFGDMTANQVFRLQADGTYEAVSPKIQEPEGIVVLPDETLIVVEQATNRLYHVDPTTKTMSLFYAVGNQTKNDGIDGISPDGTKGDLLVPDAPTGRILHISADGKHVTTLLTGFVRPTSAIRASDETLYVCDEFGDKIYRVEPDGKMKVIAQINAPDDVVMGTKGHLLVNGLEGVIWDIDLQTSKLIPVVVNLQSPHGLAVDSQGNVIIADAKLNKIFRLTLPR
jgi:serine/threonine-protein kinase